MLLLNFCAINVGNNYTAGRQLQVGCERSGGNVGADGMLMAKIDELITVTCRAQNKRVVITKTDLDGFDERYQSNVSVRATHMADLLPPLIFFPVIR